MSLTNKIEKSISIIKKGEALSLKYNDYGYHLAFSGGKDSIVLHELAVMAGVKFKAVMQVTTLDPPELMKFVRQNYPHVILDRPSINFYKLIVLKKMLPLRQARFCCQYLKESAGKNTVTLLGIRRAESAKRKLRNEFELDNKRYTNSIDQFNIDLEKQVVCLNGSDKVMINPIIAWSDDDVWNFIRYRKLKYCQLYDEGYKRIGCIFCPMSSTKSKYMDRKRYPGVEREIKKSIVQLSKINNYGALFNYDVNLIFDWWISNESMEYFLNKRKLPNFNL